MTRTTRLGPQPASINPAALVSNRTGVTIVAHRGGGASWNGSYRGPHPEETLEGFSAAIACGSTALNPHASMTADGTVFCMHDATPDRTTNATGAIDISNYTTPAFKKLKVTPQTVANWPGYGVDWGEMHPPTLAEYLDRVGHRAMNIIECTKRGSQATGAVGTAVTKLLLSRGLGPTAIIQSFSAGELTYAASQGLETMFLATDLPGAGSDATSIQTTMTAASGWAPGRPKHVGFNAAPTGQTQAQVVTYIGTLVSAGMVPWAYSIATRYDRDWLVAAGVKGIIADEPVYLATSAKTIAGAVDPLSTGVWPHGLLQADSSRGRGILTNSGVQLDYTNASASTQYVCYGGFSPPSSLTAYTIQGDFVWDTLDTDATRHMDMMVCCPDDRPTSATNSVGAGTVDGYQIVLRQNGASMVVSRGSQSGQTLTGLLTQTTGLPPAASAGTVTTMKIQVTATQLIISLIQASTTYGPFTVTDSTYRGGYFHLGKAWNNSAAKLVGTWKNISCA